MPDVNPVPLSFCLRERKVSLYASYDYMESTDDCKDQVRKFGTNEEAPLETGESLLKTKALCADGTTRSIYQEINPDSQDYIGDEAALKVHKRMADRYAQHPEDFSNISKDTVNLLIDPSYYRAWRTPMWEFPIEFEDDGSVKSASYSFGVSTLSQIQKKSGCPGITFVILDWAWLLGLFMAVAAALGYYYFRGL